MHNRGLCVGKTVTSGCRGRAVGARQGRDKVQPEPDPIQPRNPPKSLRLGPNDINVFKSRGGALCFRTCPGSIPTGQKSDYCFSES